MAKNEKTFRAQARTFAARFAALGHVNRVEILRHLLTAHPTGLVVGEIQAQLDIPASTLSHHLEALRHEGLVTQAREGRFLRYRAGTEALNALLGFLYAECCAGGAVPVPSSVALDNSIGHESSVAAEGRQPARPRPRLASANERVPETASGDEAWKSW